MNFRMVHDLTDPGDPAGRTYREVNLSKAHAIPVGSLVEVRPGEGEDPDDSGQRLFVVAHDRDCDGGLLYSLAFDRRDTVRQRPGFANPRWVNGMPEWALVVVREPPGGAGGDGGR